MADEHEDNAEKLRTDAMHLADSLDGMETRDWVERVGIAVEIWRGEVCRATASAPIFFNGYGGLDWN